MAIAPIFPTATGFSLPVSRPFPNLHTMMSREVKWETPFLKNDKMKICWGGRWAKASTPTGGPEGVCELEASCQAFLRDVGTIVVVPSSIDADVAV